MVDFIIFFDIQQRESVAQAAQQVGNVTGVHEV